MEPLLSDQPKAEWSLTGGGRLQESNYRRSRPRRGPDTSTLWKIISCMQCLSYAMCSSMLTFEFFAPVPRSLRTWPILYYKTRRKKWMLALTKKNRKFLVFFLLSWHQRRLRVNENTSTCLLFHLYRLSPIFIRGGVIKWLHSLRCVTSYRCR